MRIGFAGAGNMAGAMARGWTAARGGPEAMLFADAGSGRAQALAQEVAPGAFSDGYRNAMLIAAAVAALGGLISWATIRGPEPRRAPRHPSPSQACTSCPPEEPTAPAVSVPAEGA